MTTSISSEAQTIIVGQTDKESYKADVQWPDKKRKWKDIAHVTIRVYNFLL